VPCHVERHAGLALCHPMVFLYHHGQRLSTTSPCSVATERQRHAMDPHRNTKGTFWLNQPTNLERRKRLQVLGEVLQIPRQSGHLAVNQRGDLQRGTRAVVRPTGTPVVGTAQGHHGAARTTSRMPGRSRSLSM
jgi:hypothetical protein